MTDQEPTAPEATSPEQAILNHVAATLRAMNLFAEVHIGPDRLSSADPRAGVLLRSHHIQPADDVPHALWHRLRMEVALRAAGPSVAVAMARAIDLFQRTRRALRADAFRGGRACHLPWGRATEFGPGTLGGSSKPPVSELRFELLCHFESTDQDAPSGGEE